jgi:hypothetical protein
VVCLSALAYAGAEIICVPELRYYPGAHPCDARHGRTRPRPLLIFEEPAVFRFDVLREHVMRDFADDYPVVTSHRATIEIEGQAEGLLFLNFSRMKLLEVACLLSLSSRSASWHSMPVSAGSTSSIARAMLLSTGELSAIPLRTSAI